MALIDKTNPSSKISPPLTLPKSLYNYNPQTASAVSSIPLYQAAGISLACSDCFMALKQAALYLAIRYDAIDGIGFQTIQIEADITVLANLDLTLSSSETEDTTSTHALLQDLSLFQLSFPVAGIQFTATIDANLSLVVSVKGSRAMVLTSGELLCSMHASRSGVHHRAKVNSLETTEVA